MAKIKIIENQYKTTCELYGCSNIGTMIMGEPNQNLGQRIIICPECLQNIINAAPIDMILNRPELQITDEEGFTYDVITENKEGLENVGKALEGEENLMTFEGMSFTELKKIAVEKGLQFKVGMGKDYLIEYLKGKS